MKRIFYMFLTILLFIPVMVNAEVCENDKVYIESISVDKTNNVKELEGVKSKDKNIDLFLMMGDVGDNIRYKLVLKNDSNDDYVVNKDSINVGSKYIDYEIESDNNTIVKANSSKTIYLKISYSHQAPASAFLHGTINDEITMKLNLQSGELSNPNTGLNYILFILLVLLIMIGFFIIYKKKRVSKALIPIIALSIIIPISVNALCKCDININSTIVIRERGYTGIIYRNGLEELSTGDYLVEPKEVLFNTKTNEIVFDNFLSKDECKNELHDAISNGLVNEEDFVCRIITSPIKLEYKTDPSQLDTINYIKDEIKNNLVTKTQLCFVTDKEVCFKPGDNVYEENKTILRNEEEWLQNHGWRCDFSEINADGVFCHGTDYAEIKVSQFEIDTFYRNEIGFYCNAITCHEITE